MTATAVPAHSAIDPYLRQTVRLGTQAVVHASALLRTWVRDPGVVVQTLVFPAFLLGVFHLVLGQSTTNLGLGDSIYRNTGLVALVGAMFGTIMTGLQLISERQTGLLARLSTLPVPRSGYLLGRVLAEVVRITIATVVLFAVAIPMGFRFTQGWLAGVAALLVPVIAGTGIVFVMIACATVAPRSLMEETAIPFLFMMFFNTGFAPLSEYPGWLQPIVEYQPMSPAVDALSGLTEGGPVARPLALTIVWAVGLSVVFGVLAVRGYRKAAQRSI